jgi:hypothetical protein
VDAAAAAAVCVLPAAAGAAALPRDARDGDVRDSGAGVAPPAAFPLLGGDLAPPATAALAFAGPAVPAAAFFLVLARAVTGSGGASMNVGRDAAPSTRMRMTCPPADSTACTSFSISPLSK